MRTLHPTGLTDPDTVRHGCTVTNRVTEEFGGTETRDVLQEVSCRRLQLCADPGQ